MNPKEKKKNMYILFAICAVFLSIMGILIFLMVRGEEVASQSPLSSQEPNSTIPSGSEPSNSEMATTPNPTNTAPQFTLLESASPTWQGVNEYKLAPAAAANVVCNDSTKMDGVVTFTGHQVYHVDEGGQSQYLVLYGTDIQYVDAKGWMPNLAFCRKEWTGERIYVLDTQREVDEYTKAWQAGQKIISGEVAADKGTILVNGRLLSGYQYYDVQGELYVPLAAIARAVDPWSFAENGEAKTIQFSVYRPDGYECLIVPYDQTQVGSHHFESQKFASGNYFEEYGDVWNEMFRHGDGGSLCYVPVSELSRYTGWYIYTADNIVSIVTSDLDVTNNFVLNTQGAQSLEEQLKRGDSAEITVDNDFYLENKEEIDRLTQEILAQNEK